jgi:hypothetical protein
MSKAFRQSAFERNERDAYYTEPWVTQSLLRVAGPRLKEIGEVWEPAVGRGDIALELMNYGLGAQCSDIVADNVLFEVSEHPNCVALEQGDFFAANTAGAPAIVTNPPFGKLASRFIRKAMSLNSPFIAMLLRTDFNHGSKVTDLFNGTRHAPFAYEIVLTSRPRWDWWMTPEQKRAAKIAAGKDPDSKDASPMHNFSWFVWDRGWEGRSTQFWEGKE